MKRISTLLFVALCLCLSAAAFGQTDATPMWTTGPVSIATPGVPLSGDYYIPQGGNPQGYATLEAAILDLNTEGASGTVRFLIDNDLNEIGANLKILRTDLTATNNLVIKPAPTKTPTITITGCITTAGPLQYGGINIDSTSYVTIDGSNTDGGTTRDLTISMNDSTNGRIAINVFANCDFLVIKNLRIIYQKILAGNTTSRGIYTNGQTAGASDSVIIDNCQIGDGTRDPAYAVSITGFSTTPINASKIYVTNNTLYGTLRRIYFFRVGIASTTSEIRANTILGPNPPPSGNVSWGILFNTYEGIYNILKNKMTTLRQASAGTEGLYGFGTLSGGTSVVLNIVNNFLGGDFDHTGAGSTASIDVISLQDNTADANIYFNTVVLNSMTKTATTRMSCIRFGGTANVDLKSNIFINNKDATTAFGIRFDGGTLSSNYNDIYVSGATANIGYSGGQLRETFAEWKDSTSQDANSTSKAVTFTSNTDLHLAGGSIGDFDLKGIPNATYTTDIDGHTRDTQAPYMGADERPEAYLPIQLASFTAQQRNASVLLQWRTLSEINNYGFYVQKRRVGEQQWIEIAGSFISGNGTTNMPHDYSYTDNSIASGAWEYRLNQVDLDNTVNYTEPVRVDIVTSVGEPTPREFSLAQNYPNPFNPSTTFRFEIAKPELVTLKIYDMLGREVATVVNEQMSAGRYVLPFNASNLASGTYIYRLQAGSFVATKKMSLMK